MERKQRRSGFRSLGANPVRHLPDGTSVLMLNYKGQLLECFIDTADYPLVQTYRWYAEKNERTFYASTAIRSNGTRTLLRMHRLLRPRTKTLDHADRNGLNNRRLNLRPATRSQSAANRNKQKGTWTSKFRGVSQNQAANKWVAQIYVRSVTEFLGLFDSEESAARAYDTAARKHFGRFANVNFPQGE